MAVGIILILHFCSSTLILRAQTLPELPQLLSENFGPSVREQVREAYRDARTKPRDAGTQGRLGMVLQAYEQYELAAICYERARHLDPSAFQWVYYLGIVQATLGKYTEAAATLKEALRLKPDYFPAQLKLAEFLLASREIGESERLYESALRRYPDSALAHYGLGRVKAAQGELAAAIEHYRRASELSRNFGAAHYALGLAYRNLGQMDKAQEHLSLYEKNKLVRPQLEDPLLSAVEKLNIGAIDHYKKGVNLEAAGHVVQALAEFERALEINPRLAQAHVNLISLYGRLGQPEKAEKHYRASVELDPNLAENHYNYGVLLTGQGKYKEAAAAFSRSIEINPFYAEAHHNYGVMLEREGQLDAAMRHYRTAIENKPNYRQSHFNLGRILVHQGKLTEAINHFLQTLTPEDEDTPRFLYALASTYARARQNRRAIHYAREARQRAASLGQTELLRLIERDLRILEGAGTTP